MGSLRQLVTAVPAALPALPTRRVLPVSAAAALQRRIGNGAMRTMVEERRTAPVPGPAVSGPAPAGAAPQAEPPSAPVARGGAAKGEAAPAAKRLAAGEAPPAAQAGKAQTDEPAPEEGRLTILKAQVAGAARGQKKPANSAALVKRTRLSAVARGPEGRSNAAAATLEKLESTEKETVPFDTAAFKQALRDKLLKTMPDSKSGDDARKAVSPETGAAIATEMKGQLANTQARTVGDLPSATERPEDPKKHEPGDPPQLVQTPPGARPAAPSAAGAVPEKLPEAALDTQVDRKDADAQLASENISQGQLKRSNEPSFIDTAETRDAAERHAEAGPPEVRKAEEQARAEALARGKGALAAGISGLFGSRAAGFLRVFGQQDAAKAKEEAQRTQIAQDLDNIKSKTSSDVKQLLDFMESVALFKFNHGLLLARWAFELQLKKTEAIIRKINREDAMSSGNIFGAAWAGWGDLSADDAELTIRWARKAYNKEIDRVIDDVANFVGPVLTRIKQRIEKGKKEAADYVSRLKGSVADIAAVELDRINGEFDMLSADVDSRRDGLITKLSESYEASKKAIEARAQAFRDANKSWWQKLKEKVRGVIRAIISIKDLFVSILSRLVGVVGAILSDPIGFLGNLVSGVKRGLGNFVTKFPTHLKEGFFKWLFGAAAKAGIEIPKTFDAPGMFGLLASVLGLTRENVRARAVNKAGESLVSKLEAGAGILLVLKEKGLPGLWDMLIEKLDALKESVIAQIQSMLLIEVIKAGVAWIIGLLNPAAGFIKACKAIYEIVMFFVKNGRAVVEFVDAVIDSIGAIAKGQLDAAAEKVENALARTIPLIIGFLAALLSLGSIADKVKKIIDRIQAPVNKAIDWLIDKAVGLVKGAGRAVGKAAKGLFNWARAKVGFKDASGATHTIYVEVAGAAPKLMIATEPMGARAFLNTYVDRKKSENSKFKTGRKADIEAADEAIEAAEKQVKVVAKARQKTGKSAESELSSELEKLLQLNVVVSAKLSKLIGGDESVGDEVEERYFLEGVTGTYASIPKPKGDELTADHQPQAAILQAAAKMKIFKGSGEMEERAEGRAAKGFAINLHHKRHIAGRTFGSKGKKTKEDFIDLVKDKVKNLTTELGQRKAAIRVIREHLKADSEMMKNDVCGAGSAHFDDIDILVPDEKKKKKIISGIKSRIKAGEDQMVNQDLDSLID